MRFSGSLTPHQAAAFWRLGLLSGDDIAGLAMQWLEAGAESPNVAVLASEPDVTVRDHGQLFDKCLRDLGVEVSINEREAAWTYVQALLNAVKEGVMSGLDATHDALALHNRGVSLFPTRNLAGDGKAYAGEELGLEQMLGLYWALDDVGASDVEVEAVTRELEAECLRVLDAFYTTRPLNLMG